MGDLHVAGTNTSETRQFICIHRSWYSRKIEKYAVVSCHPSPLFYRLVPYTFNLQIEWKLFITSRSYGSPAPNTHFHELSFFFFRQSTLQLALSTKVNCMYFTCVHHCLVSEILSAPHAKLVIVCPFFVRRTRITKILKTKM